MVEKTSCFARRFLSVEQIQAAIQGAASTKVGKNLFIEEKTPYCLGMHSQRS